MFFFVGGLSSSAPRVLKAGVGPCAKGCGEVVDVVETKTVLSLFFVPVWSFAPTQFLLCRRCRTVCTESEYKLNGEDTYSEPRDDIGIPLDLCASCSRAVDRAWTYCPFCGHLLR